MDTCRQAHNAQTWRTQPRALGTERNGNGRPKKVAAFYVGRQHRLAAGFLPTWQWLAVGRCATGWATQPSTQRAGAHCIARGVGGPGASFELAMAICFCS